MAEDRFAEGFATLAPGDPVAASSAGAWTLTYTAGEDGLDPGAGILVVIPDGFSPPQMHDPDAPGFVRAESSNYEALIRVATGILPGAAELSGAGSRGGHVLMVVETAPIRAEESIRLLYGHPPGCAHVSARAGQMPFTVWVRPDAASDRFAPIPSFPSLTVDAGPIAHLEAISPSCATSEDGVEVRVVARDANRNRCRGWTGWFEVETEQPGVRPPPVRRVEDVTGDGVSVAVRVDGPTEAPVRVVVREKETGLEARSNPCVIDGSAPIWGDLHALVDNDRPSRDELDFELSVGQPTADGPESFAFQIAPPEGDVGSRQVFRSSLPDVAREEMLSTHALEIYSSSGLA